MRNLFFLDSDDVIHPRLLEALYRQQKAMRAEIASAGVCRTGESYAKIQKNWTLSSLERESGRMSNAVQMEKGVTDAIMQWYIYGRNSSDPGLARYAGKLADREKRYDMFKQIDWERKVRFWIQFHCYPIYRVIHWFNPICQRIRVSQLSSSWGFHGW